MKFSKHTGRFEKSSRPLSLILTILGVTACGSVQEEKPEQGPIRVSWPVTDQGNLSDAEFPPFDMRETSFIGSGRFNSIFWLDFEGATVRSNESFIVEKAGRTQVEIPAFSPADIGSNEDREAIKLNIIQNLVPLFPDVDIKITLTKPLADVYSRVHIGGNNFTGKQRVLGIAPLDLGNRSGNDIIFVYTKEMRNLGNQATAKAQLTHVIAHEMAHALGARHINSDFALMKPSVSIEADSFNIAAPVVDAPKETENSLQILLNSAGSRSVAFAEKALPNIVDLAAFSTGGVIQYTVISKANFVQNPGLQLADFNYQWVYDGKQSEGTSVLMTFTDREDHILNLTVRDDSGKSRKFQFSVGSRR